MRSISISHELARSQDVAELADRTA